MSDTKLWQGAVLPASIAAIFALIIDVILKGKAGFIGGALASVTVIIFFSVHLLVAKVSRELDPTATMILAMLSYFVKITFMGLFLILINKFTNRSTVDRTSFAISAVLITMSWLVGEIRTFTKLRFQMPLPAKIPDNKD